MKRTPIAIFIYRRPEHTRRLLDSLARCARLDECDLFVFADGPATPADAESVAAARAVVREWAQRHTFEFRESHENRGLARSIVAGATELCQRAGRVIVLEDDLTLSPDFLSYILTSLDRYESETSVHQISGFVYPHTSRGSDDAFFLPFTSSWGWATWWRAWQSFAWDPAQIQDLQNTDTRRRFDINASYPWSKLLEDRVAGRNESWHVLWYWGVFRQAGLALYPRRSLVDVGGFDSTGTHGGRPEEALPQTRVENVRLQDVLKFPAKIATDSTALRSIVRFLRVWSHATVPMGKRMRYWLSYRIEGLATRLHKGLAAPLRYAALALRHQNHKP